MLSLSAEDVCDEFGVLGSTGWQRFTYDISDLPTLANLAIYAGNGATPFHTTSPQTWAYVDDIVLHAPEPSTPLLAACALVTLALLQKRTA